jgi:hypothetical protein
LPKSAQLLIGYIRRLIGQTSPVKATGQIGLH